MGPTGSGSELGRVVGTVIELGRNVLVDIGVTGLVAHDAAVFQHSFTRQPFLPAGNPGGQITQVTHEQLTRPLFGSYIAQNALTEAALVQLVNSQELGNGDVAGLQLKGAEPAAPNRKRVNTGQHKRRGLAVALLVVGQNLGRAKHIQRQIGGEIAAFEEGGLWGQNRNRRQHIQGVIDIHFVVLLTPSATE